MADVLFISKPIAPPWNDSGKNLVHDLARSLTRHRASIMTRAGSELSVPNATLEQVYPADAGGFAPALANNARVLKRLLTGPKKDLWHFFFAPNVRSSQLGKLAQRVRGVRTVHTIASAPKADARIRDVIFADMSVVLSKHTEARLLSEGVSTARMVRIAPAIVALTPPDTESRVGSRTRFALPKDAPVIVYPGDLEFGFGAELVIDALPLLKEREAHLVMACRAKTAGAHQAAMALKARATQLGIESRVSWPGETREIHALLGCADVVVLPSRDLYAKMDYPLVLLEAMSLSRAVVVANNTPAAELAEEGGADAVDADPSALATRLDALISDAALRARYGTKGRELVLTKYSPEVMASAYERVYDTLLR